MILSIQYIYIYSKYHPNSYFLTIRTLIAPIELMTNTKGYFIGKPNPLIMNYAMNTLKTGRRDTVIIGDRYLYHIYYYYDMISLPSILSTLTDTRLSSFYLSLTATRMDTDIQAGIEIGIDTLLVLTGITQREDLKSFAFKPTYILDGVKDLN